MMYPLTSVASNINAVATVILVVITGVYAFLTWRLVKETRSAREQEAAPALNLDVAPFSFGAWVPKIENLGNGPALDVSGTVRLEPGGEEYDFHSKNIAAGEFTGTLEPKVNDESHLDYGSLIAKGSYTDVFGNYTEFIEEYDLEILASLDGAESILDRDDGLRYMRNMEGHLRTIADNIEMEGFEKLLQIKTRGTILSHLRDDGPLSVRELSQKTGLTHFEMGTDLMWLKEAGAIDYDVERDEIINEENLDVEILLQEGRNVEEN